jgi:hypothetical protein
MTVSQCIEMSEGGLTMPLRVEYARARSREARLNGPNLITEERRKGGHARGGRK